MLDLTRAVLLRRGLAVFPLPPGSKEAPPGWQRRCTTDPAVIARWPAVSNTGIGCRSSSIVGLDLDRHPGKPDGVASFARLAGEHGAGWPSTFTVATPSGGLHLYFRVSAGDGFASAIGWLPGVDIRGPGRKTGGYLAGPGSVTAAGRYVVAADVEVAPLPRWLYPLLPVAVKPGTPGRGERLPGEGFPVASSAETTISRAWPHGLNFLIGRRHYQPWGLVFDRQSVYDAGGGPVWYARPDEYYSARQRQCSHLPAAVPERGNGLGKRAVLKVHPGAASGLRSSLAEVAQGSRPGARDR